MAVGRENRLVTVGHPCHDGTEQGAEFIGHGIADGIRDVDGARPGGNCRFNGAAEEIDVAARAVLARPLHISAQVPRQAHTVGNRFQHLLGLHPQLILHMQRAGGNKGMNAGMRSTLEGLGSAGNITLLRAGKATNAGITDGCGNALDGFKIAVGGSGEPRFDHIDPHAFKGAGDADFFLKRHAGAGRLFAIAQGCIKNDDLLLGHDKVPA